jgi:acetyl-CoA carboxylase carboxyltransferase component
MAVNRPHEQAQPRGGHDLRALTTLILAQEERIKEGGGVEAIERQHSKGRKTARERIAGLLDADSTSLELGLWSAHEMYQEWGGAPGAGVVTVIGLVAGRRVMVIANVDQEKSPRPDDRQPEQPAHCLSGRLVGSLLANARRSLS